MSVSVRRDRPWRAIVAAEAEAGVTDGRFPEPRAHPFPRSLPAFSPQGPGFPASVPGFVPTMPHLHRRHPSPLPRPPDAPSSRRAVIQAEASGRTAVLI